MQMSRTKRRAWAAALIGVVLIGVAWGTWQLALQQLRARLMAALGPRAEVQAITVGWSGVTVSGLHLAAEAGWPDAEELSAQRIWLQPALDSLWSGPWRIRRIEVEDGHISLLRNRQGKLRLLPGLLDTPAAEPPPAHAATRKVSATPASAASANASAGQAGVRGHVGDALVINTIVLRRVQVDLYDDSFRPALRQPHHVQLADLAAQVGNLHLPALDQAIDLELQASVRGGNQNSGAKAPAPQDGTLNLQGEFTPASHDARIQAQVKGVDLRVLQPYLLTVNAGGVRQGRLDLNLQATVKANHLHAPGTVTLTGLELGHGSGWWDRFGAAGRQAMLNTLADKGRIEVHFTLDGRLDDPNFSVNDSLAQRFATGLAQALGVSVGGVVEGVGQMIKGLFGR
ncbi:DUF748 domain-containing protein [Ideonella sp. B508-1]|uniref:DUF748 domain-containing protein n=1 Tax=Ideonella sp. B508-1 TaxID=137716 RepID=UPI0009FBFA2B|nr:DUF748 domain-containing protein [Ideonella sp. B508-1]